MAQKGPKSYLRGVISYQNKPKKAKKEPIWGPKGGVFGRAGRGPRGGSEGGGTPPGGGVPGGSGGSKMALPRGGPWLSTFWPLFIGDFSGAFGLADGWQGGGTPPKGPKMAKKAQNRGGPPPAGGGFRRLKNWPKRGYFWGIGGRRGPF